jgi:hypothetical protein
VFVFDHYTIEISQWVLKKISDRGFSRLDVELAIYTSDDPAVQDHPDHTPPETWLFIGESLNGTTVEVYVTPLHEAKVLAVKSLFIFEEP